MAIVIGSDHAGFELKEQLKKYLDKAKLGYKDVGVYNSEPSDYPDIAALVAREVSGGVYGQGILICGSGIGMSIAANKYHNIRAALCYNEEIAKLSREHNDSNVLVLGARMTKKGLAKKILKAWLETPFSGEERHRRRIEKIKGIEEKVR